jgi:hypothetical protein
MGRTRLILAVWFSACPLSMWGFANHATAEYGYAKVQGHGVYVSPEAMADKALMNRVLVRLDFDLKKIRELLPPAAMKPLEEVPFWLEGNNPGMTMYYRGRAQTGIDPDKRGGIEVNNMRQYLSAVAFKPFLVLHEMSHAYHDRVLGFDNGIVRWAFDLAVASHRYESVSHIVGVGGGTGVRKERAYALTDEREYFAELSSSYWGRNDYYPYTRADLAEFDPAGLAMLEKVWLGE